MLNCVYHAVDAMRVVDEDERIKLLESGHWFDSPKEAQLAKQKYENEILAEKSDKPARKSRIKLEKPHEE